MKNTAQLRLTFDVLIDRHPAWKLEDMVDRFYHSQTCAFLSDQETGFFTYSHLIIADLFEAELQGDDAFREVLGQLSY